MKRTDLILAGLLAALTANAQSTTLPTAWGSYASTPGYDRHVVFDTDVIGKKLPILWGFDTAWNDYANMLRGVRHSGADAVSCARVSFQPWLGISEKGVLPDMLQKNLDARMETVALIGKKVDIVLNLDGGDNTVKSIYGGYKYENPDDPWGSPKTYIGNVEEQGPRWADLIDATAAAVEAKGYRVITASPLNEPDLEINGTPIELFYQIAKNLKDFDNYPRFKDIRISGGNTLNNDEADKWYEYNKEFLDEGNTHQLAGSFDTYAAFFQKVREDGRHATADELHNVMEAMVGVEYGMQTGIWWGTAERARGEFMKASFGDRLGYAENRDAWSAAAVYRSPEGKLQGFVGCSERQARPSTFNFVSAKTPFFVNGVGPLREYVANVPGDPNGAYQTEQQRNAEAVLDISQGLDAQPLLSGDYFIVNAASKMVISGRNGSVSDGSDIVQSAPSGSNDQIWNVDFVPETWGGDFSYYFIKNINGAIVKSLDDNNWNLETGGKVISYGFSGAGVQQWAMEYAGNGYFRIRNKYSALYLTVADNNSATMVTQEEYADTDRQLWRFVPSVASIEFEPPTMPEGVCAAANSASVELAWQPASDSQPVNYTIARADADYEEFNVIARGITDTHFLDNSLSAADRYRYMVMAEDAAGNRSAFSEKIEVSLAGQPKGMIARYSFNDNTLDELENRLDLKMSGSISYRTGVTDGSKCANFRSDANCQLPYSVLASDEFSVTLWFRVLTAQNGKCLFSTGLGEDQLLELYPYTNGNIELRAVSGDETCALSAASPAASEWHHVAIVVSKDNARLYLNGAEAENGDPTLLRQSLPADRVLTYLCADINRKNIFSGFVADLRVFNKAVSPEEIKLIMADESGIDDVYSDEKEVRGIEYYTPSGIRLAQPADNGITIKRTIFTDGSSKVVKLHDGKGV